MNEEELREFVRKNYDKIVKILEELAEEEAEETVEKVEEEIDIEEGKKTLCNVLSGLMSTIVDLGQEFALEAEATGVEVSIMTKSGRKSMRGLITALSVDAERLGCDEHIDTHWKVAFRYFG